MDLSAFKFLGLNLVEWASILAVILAIPPLLKLVKNKSEASRDSLGRGAGESPDRVVAAGSGGTAESLDRLSKAFIAAPLVYAGASVVAEVARDRFGDAALEALATATSQAAAQAAGDLAVSAGASALDATVVGAGPDGSTAGHDGGIVDGILNIFT